MSKSESRTRIDDVFPYDSFRENQEEGIEEIFRTSLDNGFSVIEGSCGTGKTLMALTPLITIIENTKEFDRILVITNVKQQQKAIQSDIRRINENREKSVDSISLVGKSDLCPYVKSDTIDKKAIYQECDTLRDNTVNSNTDYEDLLSKSLNSYNSIPTGTIPKEESKEYCPFYAETQRKKASDKETHIPFLSRKGLIDSEDIYESSKSRGLCPYYSMIDGFEELDIIIANYNHVFDKKTSKQLTEEIIDDSTFIVIDEAHNLVKEVRSLLSSKKSLNKIKESYHELNSILKIYNLNPETIKNKIENKGVTRENNKQYNKTKEYLIQESPYLNKGDPLTDKKMLEAYNLIEEKIDTSIIKQIKEWKNIFKDFLKSTSNLIKRKTNNNNNNNNNNNINSEEKIPLRDPEEIKIDNITQWFNIKNYGETIKEKSITEPVKIIEALYNINQKEDDPVNYTLTLPSVKQYLKKWIETDNVNYFKLINIKENKKPNNKITEEEYFWEPNYTAELEIFNCVPKNEIKNKLSKFGGGVLMSATLNPINVFLKTTGLNSIDRRVNVLKYGLPFPSENRKSLNINTTKFKYNNRENPENNLTKKTINNTRKEYLEIIEKGIKNNPGNKLIIMPNYSEGKWVKKALKNIYNINENKILLDSGNTKDYIREKMKRQFFNNPEKNILITSAHGTLIEGVDYKEDKLNSVILCGVPIENTNGIKSDAILTAYEEHFDEGYKYAFIAPAVRKARQSIGRVIRTNTDKGTRILADKRYCDNNEWDNVNNLLSNQEQKEFKTIKKEKLEKELKKFWS